MHFNNASQAEQTIQSEVPSDEIHFNIAYQAEQTIQSEINRERPLVTGKDGRYQPDFRWIQRLFGVRIDRPPLSRMLSSKRQSGTRTFLTRTLGARPFHAQEAELGIQHTRYR